MRTECDSSTLTPPRHSRNLSLRAAGRNWRYWNFQAGEHAMDEKRRTILATGGAATAAAPALPGAYAQPRNQGDRKMPFYEKGAVRIRYDEAGSGFPLLCIPGGGST